MESASSRDERKRHIPALTRQYRESVLRLTASYNESAAWETSQHILDQLWADNVKSYPQQAVVYVCQTCGFVIQPGYMGTRLRVVRTNHESKTRTLRRREHRKRRKLALAQQKQASDSNGRKNPQEDYTSDSKFLLLADDSSVVFDRHHLVIRCGRCKEKVRCKGLKRENPRAPTTATEARVLPKRKEAIGASKPMLSSNDTTEVIQLPSVRKNSVATPLFKQLGHKKKKRKEPPKSNLMNFLNSLND